MEHPRLPGAVPALPHAGRRHPGQPRVETLLELLEGVFGTFSTGALGEARGAGERSPPRKLSAAFRHLTDWWDQFASYVIEDLPQVRGHESWESANRVAEVLKEWRAAGEAAETSASAEKLEQFESAQAYALGCRCPADEEGSRRLDGPPDAVA